MEADAAISTLTIAMWAGIGLVAGALASVLLSVVGRVIVHRHPRMEGLTGSMRMPQRVFCLLLGTGLGVLIPTAPALGSSVPVWRQYFSQGFLIVMIMAMALLLTGVIQTAEDAIVHKQSSEDEETPHYRRIRTQMQIISRVAIAVVWVCALAGALLTFEAFRAVGASLIASAGVLSIVAGLAVQSSLANVFAGMQIAFSDALRVGDLIVFETQQGSVEEITLTYVVVRTWDDRRWIVPSNYFTTKAFENWTRREPRLLGEVGMDLDWLVPIEAMRVELMRIVRSSDLWDGRSASLQVTDATGGLVRVRAVVSAATSGELWDLRCYVREELISWLQHHAVYALPRTRLEPETTTAPTVEERDEFEAKAVQEFRAEELNDETQVMAPVEEVEPHQADDRALPKWLQSWLSNRKHEEAAALPFRVDFEAKPGEAETPTETTLGSRSAQARLYSGSPEAEERNRQMSGPSAADMAEREQAAERRQRTGEQEAVGADGRPPSKADTGRQQAIETRIMPRVDPKAPAPSDDED